MIKKMRIFTGAIILLGLTGSCSNAQKSQDISPEADLPNPASEYCIEQGYTLEIITAADGSQSGICTFDDGSSCDEWAYFRGECGPSSLENTPEAAADSNTSPTSSPSEISSIPTINPADYQGWWTYTQPDYSFSIMLPEDWVVEEITTADSLMSGHSLNLRPKDIAPDVVFTKENIRMSFRLVGEDVRIWPTGVGQGEFVPQGTLEVAGEPVLRYLLVCPSGETTSIWYHQADGVPNITRGDLEFGFIFSASPSHCEPGYTLEGKNQLQGEMIISSLRVP
jgi:putative hemolysin